MKFKTRAFDQRADLERFVNENGIQKDMIVDISQTKDGQFVIYYYADE